MTDETITTADDLPDTDGAPEGESPQETIARLQAEAQEWREHALRAAAEAENVKRRAEREGNDARAYAIQKFARDLFGVADNLQRALFAAPRDHAEAGVKNLVLGIEMTEKELLGAFERNGLKRLEPTRGEKFDPNKHQAMTEQPVEDVAAGGVVQVMQAGYELFGRVLRPAMVVVAVKGSGAALEPANDRSGGYESAAGEAGGALDTKA